MATNARIIRIFTSTAIPDFNTLLNIAMPPSVKAYGRYLVPPLPFEVAICDLKLLSSSRVSSNMKSSGKRSIFLLTCSLRRLVSTPYSIAKSVSSITCFSLMNLISDSILIVLRSQFATSKFVDWSQFATGCLFSVFIVFFAM